MEDKEANPKKTSIINYVENFIDKRDNELRRSGNGETENPLARGIDRDSIIIETNVNNAARENTVNISENFIRTSSFSNGIINHSYILIEFHFLESTSIRTR